MRTIIGCIAVSCALLGSPSGARALDPARAWLDYHAQQSAHRLDYETQGEAPFDGGLRRHFLLHSQRWPAPLASGSRWSHRVEILTPDHPQPGPALLVINNGIRGADGAAPMRVADDLSAGLLEELSRRLGMAVVSIADVPDQPLRLPGDDRYRVEDDLVALSWRGFLDAPQDKAHWPLHLPMAQAATRAMDLAGQELPPSLRPSFVVTGASKRAWAAWLLPLVDDRVSHLLPFVMDMHWEALAPHIQRSYGQRWPIALLPYSQHGITARLGSPGFRALMQGSDPYSYLGGPLRERLALPKYLVNASGDDFFTPDATQFYLHALSGETTLRMAPNSDHQGIRTVMESSLLPALRRWRSGLSLPQLQSGWRADGGAGSLRVRSSEVPVEMVLWTAHNPDDRDFRYACGVRYQAQPLEIAAGRDWAVPLQPVQRGWSTSFVELRYGDGFVATTPAYVYPHDRFPAHPPPEKVGGCRLVPEQG